MGFSAAGVRKFISGTPTVGGETATDVDDLWPYRDSLSASYFPPSQGAYNAFGYNAAYREAGEPGPGIITHTIFDGGEPIETFIEGTPAFDLLIGYCSNVGRIAALYGRTVDMRSLTYIQGDGGSASTYATVMDAMTTSLQNWISAAMGLATPPTLLVWQTAHRDDSAVIDLNAIHQAEAAAARPADIKISCAMHAGRRGDGDPIHIDPESRMFLGSAHGEVKRRVDSGEGWDTFRVASATLVGNTITLAYTCPSLRDLEFDPGRTVDPINGWVPPTPNYGYRYADDSSGVTIASVALAKDSNGLLHNVVLTLTGDPGAATGKTVGIGDTNNLVTKWAPYRCQLRTQAGLRCVWRDMGYDVPEQVYHYAIRERITL
jgi:hypothetical protein